VSQFQCIRHKSHVSWRRIDTYASTVTSSVLGRAVKYKTLVREAVWSRSDGSAICNETVVTETERQGEGCSQLAGGEVL
jgi:hypothetical protein